MKQYILLLSLLMASLFAQSQQPVMVGMTGGDGANGAGSIVAYTGGTDSIGAVYSLPADADFSGSYSQRMTQAANGKLYGLTDGAGLGDGGYLFEYSYTGQVFTPKVYFDSMTGYQILSSLLLARSGILYGVTGAGGANNGGTIFSYRAGDTTVTKLYDLPAGSLAFTTLVQVGDSNLYGMTNSDGANSAGTIFRFNILSNTYTVLFNFPAGALPMGKLEQFGRDTLYGCTMDDGANGGGTLFRYVIGQPSDTVLYNFQLNANPSSALNPGPDGLLYGLTYSDGTNGYGTIFNFTPGTNTVNVVYNFGDSANDANSPLGGMTLGSDSVFYGMANMGGVNGSGAVFTYNALTTVYNKVADLSLATGDVPAFGNMVQYYAAPVVTSSPQSETVCPGAVLTNTVSATGQNLRYQWVVSTNGGSTYTDIPGQTGSTYTVTAVPAYNGYIIAVIVANTGGTDTSAPATLTVVHIDDSATVSGPVCAASQAGAAYQWLDCSTGLPIGGATAQSYTATADGSYSCIVTLSGCVDTTTCQAVTGVGIYTVPSPAISLSPNPATGIVTVANTDGGKITLRILSLVGEELVQMDMEGAYGTFDMGAYATGVYIVTITGHGQLLSTAKLVKE